MIFTIFADFVMFFHLLFVIFALTGGIIVLKWKGVAWIHIPAAIWAALIEFTGGICPLTPLENMLRQKSGDTGYKTDFIEQYLLPVLYPDYLTHNLQVVLGLFVVVVNTGIYAWVWRRSKKLRLKKT